MFSITVNTAQTIAQYSHRINKATSVLLSAPVKGYSGNCPFLRGLSTVSSYTSASSDNEPKNLFGVESYEEQQQAQQQIDNNQHTVASSKQQVAKNDCSDQQQQQQLQPQSLLHEQLPAANEQVATSERCPREASLGSSPNADSSHLRAKPDADQKQQTRNIIYDYRSRLNELIENKRSDESYRVFRKVRRFSSNFPHGTEQGRPVTIWCSNDYFGMSSHPKVREAIIRALDKYGSGSGGTRNIAGNNPVHEALEWELADLHQKEAALLFSSCYVANDSTLYTLLKLIPNCQVFSDAGNHASMIQGIRNSGARKHIFRAFDPVDLEEKLKQVPISAPKLVAFETVHSMTGDISQVERMCDISHKYGALTFVDEVHAVGLYGERGAGIGQRDNCMDKIDIVSGTLGKAYGNCGGYVASTAEMIDVIRSYAAGFIFTTSLPPMVACGATESVKILKGDEGRQLRQLQQSNVFHMKRALTAAGLPHYHSKSHIIPIPVGNAAKCTQVSNDLLNLGHYIQSINYPTVPRGTERLRVSVTPFHDEHMIDSLIERLVSIWQQNELSFLPPVEVPNQCKRHQVKQDQDTQVGQSLWCDLCHKEMGLCTWSPNDGKILRAR